MSATNRGAKRAERDLYVTKAWHVEVFLAADPGLPDGIWCEPACADGAIIRAVEARRPLQQKWLASDIRPDCGIEKIAVGSVEVIPHGDFLDPKRTGLNGADVYITNPPFFRAEEFARECIRRGGGRAHVALLLPLNFLESLERVAFHREFPCPDVYTFAKRPGFGLNKHGKAGTDANAMAWFVWGPGRAGRVRPPLVLQEDLDRHAARKASAAAKEKDKAARKAAQMTIGDFISVPCPGCGEMSKPGTCGVCGAEVSA